MIITFEESRPFLVAIKFLLHNVKLEPTVNFVNPDSQDTAILNVQNSFKINK